MNFTEPAFLMFFAAFLPLYFYFGDDLRRQNGIITVASYFFYGWFDWRFLGLLFLSTIVDFYLALVIDNANQQDGARSKAIAKYSMIGSVAFNLAMLGFFKYWDFFAGSLQVATERLGIPAALPILQIALPAGISFYTFQSLSYVIDVYDGKLRATPRLVDFAAYISFFPHLVAGPILRGAFLMPKITHKRTPSLQMAVSGIQLALWGFFTKLVIADNMGAVANGILRNPAANGASIIIAMYAFAFQIYGDFLGYTNIARGISRIMGFELVLNFNLPYFATNPQDFWRRWHISLSTWFRDYFYIRIGGSRRGRLITSRNLLLTMLVAGLWHGASWNFVLWGLYHGLLLAAFHLLHRDSTDHRCGFGFGNLVRIGLYFQVTCVGWLIFRTTSLPELASRFHSLVFNTHIADFRSTEAAVLLCYSVPFVCFEAYQYLANDLEPWRRWPPIVRAASYSAIIVLIAVLFPEVQTPFIYFQF